MSKKIIAGMNLTAESGKFGAMHPLLHKGSEFAQDAKILSGFSEPRTMLEVSRMVSVERASICWAVSRLKKNHKLFYCGTRLCRVSGAKAGTYCSRKEKEVSL